MSKSKLDNGKKEIPKERSSNTVRKTEVKKTRVHNKVQNRIHNFILQS